MVLSLMTNSRIDPDERQYDHPKPEPRPDERGGRPRSIGRRAEDACRLTSVPGQAGPAAAAGRDGSDPPLAGLDAATDLWRYDRLPFPDAPREQNG
jgi:hypothetical protein